MCMEDIRIGRKSWVRASVVAVGAASFATLPSDAKRVAVILQCPTAARTIIVVAGNDLNAGRFAQLTQAQYNPPLTIQMYGQLIVGPITFADSSAAGITVHVYELFLDDV